MKSLATEYMGLELKNPLVVASCGLTKTLHGVQQAAEAGAGAIVLKSLFEEQISADIDELTHQSQHTAHTEAYDYLHGFGRSLGPRDYLDLVNKSPLPLGIVVSGNWPLCISRTISEDIRIGEPFKSPKGEIAWVKKYGSDYWTFPNWQIDFKAKTKDLQKAGYRLFLHMIEPIPKRVKMKKRQGLWNWKVGLNQTQRARTINREKLEVNEVLAQLKDPETFRSKIFYNYTKMIKTRIRQSAFHPNADFEILEIDPKAFVIARYAKGQIIYAVTNISSKQVIVSLYGAKAPLWMKDLITGTRFRTDALKLDPYQYLWLSTTNR